MTIQECYDRMQGDFPGACKRLINEIMVVRFAIKFLEDPSMQLLREAVKNKDIETSFRSVHTLKGVSGNLGFTDLFVAANTLTEQLRPRQEQANQDMLEKLEIEYKRTTDILKEFKENNNYKLD